ncbi:MAG: Uncharacterized protein G01um101418_270 [Parcubacteria group bacterium Gr01-1014_18]|nr:MAG: Uncharacterized protein Greene041636_237 [Parcubacteria group bacterium Greene0416_36]TSC81288.1 MAG: Uncharacterized protein G01um101418_270 [Parcubacteria group bacterium Gr01-1014_18]TSC99310.1 MAG: Uncharacterized protein Greene101420_238 [Parcubacteria group bacterium Greene1014_20]TSD06853.1 MAG: Uncharacterized protein Greene07142_587 [Parcubacteria group bacterium Greene0714_2]
MQNKYFLFSKYFFRSSRFRFNYLIPIVTLVLGFFLFFEASFVLAQGDVLGVEPLEASGLATDSDIRIVIANVIRIILGFLGTLALAIALYGGFTYMTAAGDAEKVDRAKKILKNALIGLAIILSAFGLVSFLIRALSGASIGDGAGGGRFGAGGLGADAGRDAIESHYPIRGALGVPRNTKIMVTFKERIDISSVINDSGTSDDRLDDRITDAIEISPLEGSALSQSEVRAASTSDGKTFVFDPIPLLGNSRTNTPYKVTLRSGIQNINGDPIFGNLGLYEWEFEVSTVVDLTPPQVISVIPRRVTPPAEPITYARNIVVQVTFNEPMDPTSSSGIVTVDPNDDGLLSNFSNIEVFSEDAAKGRHYFPGTFSVSNLYQTVEFITHDLCGKNSCGQDVFCLPGNATLGVDVKAATLSENPPEAFGFPYDGVVDASGNSLDGTADGIGQGPGLDNYSWVFKTNNTIDLTPPVIEKVSPGLFSVEVPLKAKISALFSKPLLFKTLTSRNVILDQGFYWVTAVALGDTKAEVFIDHSGLEDNTIYNVEMNSGILDLYQNCFKPCVGPEATNQAPARARDDARRIDLTLVKQALEEYKNRTGSFNISGAGYKGSGMGLLTFSDGGDYPRSILDFLIENTSLKTKVKNLSQAGLDSGYRLYTCANDRQYSLSATMEDARAFSDPDFVEAVCMGSGPEGVSSRYGKNFAISSSNTVDARGEFASRDNIRKSDFSAIEEALRRYRATNGSFPLSAGLCSGVDGNFADALKPFLATMPGDPAFPWKTTKNYAYLNFGDTYALLGETEGLQKAQEFFLDNCGVENSGVYHYCVGDCAKVSQ